MQYSWSKDQCLLTISNIMFEEPNNFLPVVSLLLGCSSIKTVVVILSGEGKDDSGCFAEETSGGAEVFVTEGNQLVTRITVL